MTSRNRWLRRAAWALLAAVGVPALAATTFVAWARHVPWTVPAAHRGPEPLRTAAAGAVRVRYLGVSGYEISDGETVLLLDPTPTRPPPLALLTGPIEPDLALGAQWCPRADAVLVNHTHFDHVLDVPAIARRTGARVVGSQSTVNLARSRGVAAEKTQVVRPGDHLTLGTFTIDVRSSRHTKIAGLEQPMGGVVSAEAGRLWFWQYTIDQTLAYRLESRGTSIWFHPTSTFAPGEIEGPPAGTLIVGVTGEAQTPDKVEGLLAEARPRRVLPTHYDNFFQPVPRGLALMPGVDLDAARELFRARDATVDWVVLDLGETIVLPPDGRPGPEIELRER